MGESREEKAEDYWHELAILRGQENERLRGENEELRNEVEP